MTPPAGEASAKAVRKQRARRAAIRLAIGVGLPTILSMFYYGCIVTQQFESVASAWVPSIATSTTSSKS